MLALQLFAVTVTEACFMYAYTAYCKVVKESQLFCDVDGDQRVDVHLISLASSPLLSRFVKDRWGQCRSRYSLRYYKQLTMTMYQ